MARVRLEGIRKIYEDGGHIAVHGIDLDVSDGEFIVLVGPSGCGKSTTLRMIAGLESITAGTLRIGERVVNDVPPKDRDIAMVFQSYALYPHMTVRENMACALRMRRLPSGEIAARVSRAAEMLGLDSVLDRRPRQLSGGQRQRVALGRALVREPQVFLFDEPLSNLDAKLRVQMRREIARLHRDLGVTMIYVTHDQTEAMTLGDRIVVMNAGQVQQVDTPMALYDRPANLFVAGFIGSPSMNFVHGTVENDGVARFVADGGGLRVPLASAVPGAAPGRALMLGVRPESITVHGDAAGPERDDGIAATIELLEPLGNETLVHLMSEGGQALTARAAPGTLPPGGAAAGVRLTFDVTRLHFFADGAGERLG
ncbi:MAG TPA: sn-glycerol-3-phosphate ABC transporter ATP-binding protein UgpC [Gemmatimonadaceae bacterium]|nr:sn-glycerol-3-phosphate ABC transporter ATP-binding protein UgpC [Gemmatimonadaceae bacterium]